MTIEQVRQAALLRKGVRLLTATDGAQRTHIRAGQRQGIQVLSAEDLMHHRLRVVNMSANDGSTFFLYHGREGNCTERWPSRWNHTTTMV